jgi:hypothetical protein
MSMITGPQQAMLANLARYDRKGAADPIHYETRDGNLKRTLIALRQAGLVETWDDAQDATRMWAALPPLPATVTAAEVRNLMRADREFD